MKRLLIAFLSIIVCISLLASCNNKDENQNADDSNQSDNQDNIQNDEKPVDQDVIWSPDVEVSIIYVHGGVSEENLSDLFYKIGANAKDVLVYTDAAPESTHEIVVGRTGREISRQAYRALERIEAEGEEYVGYCIYSDGKSIAIAYDEGMLGQNHPEQVAIDLFMEQYASKETFKANKGVLVCERFNIIEYQEAIDNKRIEESWAKIEADLVGNYGKEMAKSTVDAFKKFYALYTDDLVSWFANLYDPVVGGYYYSNSARNTEGYLPDLESTNQALGFIVSSGMGNPADIIPKEMQKQMVNFARSLQSGENGHFYHPQWGKELTDKYPSRKGRDINNAVRILEHFDAIPVYDTPTGIKGENPIGTVLPASANLTEKLGGSMAVMVSKVILANDADAGVESHLLNDVNFKAYLEKYRAKMATDSYWVGNELESIAPQIVARDKVLAERGVTYRLADIMADWFTSFQDPETGLWEPYENNEYDCVNGILKISSAYSKVEKVVPNAEKLLMHSIDAITSEADPHHVCCVLNTWYAITILTTNISTYGGAEGKALIKELTAEYAEKYPAMIEATAKKFALFRKDDGGSKGSFSYFQTKTSETSQGLPVALENQNEGDVNSSYICSSGVMGHVFGFIGLRAVDLYTTSDAMKYRLILESLDEIIKDKEIKPVPLDLEDVESVEELMNDGILDKWTPQGEVVVEDGYSNGEASRVMRLTTLAGSDDLLQIRITKSQGSYNSIAFQSDIMFVPDTTTTYTLLFFGNQSSVKAANMQLISKPGDGVYVSVVDTDEQIKIADCEKWFTLRVEYARLTYSKIILDIFVNDKFITSSAVPYGAESTSATSVKRIQFSADKNSSGDIYFDNFFLEQFLKELPAGVEDDEGPSEAETGIATFESKPIGAYYNQRWLDRWLPGGKLEIVDATPYGAESKVLALTTAQKDDDLFQLFVTKTAESYNAVGIQTDVMFDTLPGSAFKLLIFGGPKAYELTISTEADGVYVSGPGMTKAKLADNKTWFNLQYGYAKVSDSVAYVAVIANNTLVAESTVPYDSGYVPEVSEIQRVQFAADKQRVTEGTVYFDNMIMAQLTYQLPENLPVAPPTPDEPSPEEPEIPDTPQEPAEPTDPTVETYESYDPIDTFTFDNWNGGSSACEPEIVNGSKYGVDSKVYYYRSLSGCKPEITFKFNAGESANIASFESDMMFTTTGLLNPEFQIRTSDNSLIYKFYIKADGNKVCLLDSDSKVLATLANDGEWFRFGVAASANEGGGLLITFYLNGEQIKTALNYLLDASVATVGRVRFWSESTHTGEICLDNTRILSVYADPETLPKYEFGEPDPEEPSPEEPEIPDNPEEPAEPADPTVETYETDDQLDTFYFDNWNGGDSVENTSWYGIVDGSPYGESSKVYGFETVENFKPEVTFKFSSSPTANYTFFESDMMFTTNGYLCPEFQIRTAGNIQLFSFNIKADGEKVYLLDADSNQLAELANDGEWFKFGVKGSDYEGGMAITFYLNGERIDTSLYKTGGNAYAFERIRFWTETTHVGEIYFDNTKITCSTEEFEAPIPDTPQEPDDSENGDLPFDGQGNVGDTDWT